MKGIIPAAGLGTRLLPATKSQPKEMLPIGRKPVIQYIVEEMADAGIHEILIITGKNKRAIEDHFDRDPIMLADLQKRNKYHQVAFLEELENLNVQIFYVRQAVPTGLADAVYMAKQFVGEDDFVVALGDTIIHSDKSPNHLKRLIDFHKNSASICTLSAEQIPIEESKNYGILSAKPYHSTISNGKYLIDDLVEKPEKKDAPSDLAICGRYVFKPIIFDYIERIGFGKNNEKQLTDAIRLSLEAGKITALKLSKNEIRYDTGTFVLFAKAFIAICLGDEEIGEEIRNYLSTMLLQNSNVTHPLPLPETLY